MGIINCQTPVPALLAPNPPLLDEESPLLTKHPVNGSVHATAKEWDNDADLSKSKIMWIMSSIWLGTFVAGLGEHPRWNPPAVTARGSRDLTTTIRRYGHGYTGGTDSDEL